MRATRRNPPRWWVLGPSVAALVVVIVVLATRWAAVTASQPAYLVTLLVVATAALGGVGWSSVGLGHGRAPDRSRARVLTARALGILGTVVLVLAMLWLRPLPATGVAVAAMSGSAAVRVTAPTSQIELDPTAGSTRTGLIFYPGALVDPRAYVPHLSILAAAGFPVVIVKPPCGIAFLSSGAASGAVAAHPSIARWVVGGHSLGGVVASANAGAGQSRIDGLLLWAYYPNGSIAGGTSLEVTSVSAGNDGLATPAKIAASEPYLPPATRFVVVEGAVHADFGDYGTQRGDGTPTTGRAEAQAQIEEASLALLQRVDERRGTGT